MADGGDRLRTDFSDSAVGRRLALCAELAGMDRRTRNAETTPRGKAQLRERAHAILRLLLRGEGPGADRPTDALYSRVRAARLFGKEIERARGGTAAQRLRTALLLEDLQKMAGNAVSAGWRPGDGDVSWPQTPDDFIQRDPNSPFPRESHAAPVVEEAKALGKLPDGLADRAAAAVKEHWNNVTWDEVIALAPDTHAEYVRTKELADLAALDYRGAPPEDRARLHEKWSDLCEERDAIALKLQQLGSDMAARRQAAIAASVTGLVDSVMAESEVSEEQAGQWANRNVVITKTAANRLKKLGYDPAQVLRDAAEFYRLARGRIEKVVIDSNGGRRANANSIDAHGTAGVINLGSQFDKRVLWHELGHHIEADPVAAAAARLFIRLRSEDGQVHTLRKLTGYKGYRADEKAFKNGFFHPYVGKVYPAGYTEVFSMALESFSSPVLLAQRIAQDPETFEFVIGYLRSPKTELQELHLSMRQSLREGSELAERHARDAAGEAIAREVVKITDFIPATRLPSEVGDWAKSMMPSFGIKVAGYLSRERTGTYYVMGERKDRNPETGRLGRMFVFFKLEPDATRMPMARVRVPVSEPEIARLFLWSWRENGIEPSYRQLADGAVTVSEER